MKIIAILFLPLVLLIPASGTTYIFTIALKASVTLLLRNHRIGRSYPQRLFFTFLKAISAAII